MNRLIFITSLVLLLPYFVSASEKADDLSKKADSAAYKYEPRKRFYFMGEVGFADQTFTFDDREFFSDTTRSFGFRTGYFLPEFYRFQLSLDLGHARHGSTEESITILKSELFLTPGLSQSGADFLFNNVVGNEVVFVLSRKIKMTEYGITLNYMYTRKFGVFVGSGLSDWERESRLNVLTLIGAPKSKESGEDLYGRFGARYQSSSFMAEIGYKKSILNIDRTEIEVDELVLSEGGKF